MYRNGKWGSKLSASTLHEIIRFGDQPAQLELRERAMPVQPNIPEAMEQIENTTRATTITHVQSARERWPWTRQGPRAEQQSPTGRST